MKEAKVFWVICSYLAFSLAMSIYLNLLGNNLFSYEWSYSLRTALILVSVSIPGMIYGCINFPDFKESLLESTGGFFVFLLAFPLFALFGTYFHGMDIAADELTKEVTSVIENVSPGGDKYFGMFIERELIKEEVPIGKAGSTLHRRSKNLLGVLWINGKKEKVFKAQEILSQMSFNKGTIIENASQDQIVSMFGGQAHE